MIDNVEEEVSNAGKMLGVTVRRAPINYVGPKIEPDQPKTKVEHVKSAATRVTKVKIEKPLKPKLTEEQIKKRKAERALHWYNERKNDEAMLEKRRQYAKEYHSKKIAQQQEDK